MRKITLFCTLTVPNLWSKLLPFFQINFIETDKTLQYEIDLVDGRRYCRWGCFYHKIRNGDMSQSMSGN